MGEDPENTIISAGGTASIRNNDGNPFDNQDDDEPVVSIGDRVFEVLGANSNAGNETAGFLALQNVTVRGGLSSPD